MAAKTLLRMAFVGLICPSTLWAQPSVASTFSPKKEFHENGNVKKESQVKSENKGKKTVTTTNTKEYYKDGKLRMTEVMVVTGPRPKKTKLIDYTEYHPNGKVKEKGKLRDVNDRKTFDCKKGKVTKYNPEGKPVDIAVYIRGKCKK